MAQIRVIAGLGNPGEKYSGTRHNAGFLVVDRLADERHGKWRSGFGAELCDATLGADKVTLVKPLRFMNLSGGPVQEVLSFYKRTPEELVVVHDDIDLPLGAVRFKQGGGDGGHNGLKSITGSLGTGDYIRLRIGVGRPPHGGDSEHAVSGWVLGRFSSEEQTLFDEVLVRAGMAVESLLREGLAVAQNRFN